MNEKETILEIGIGRNSEPFLSRARENPGKIFLVVEPDKRVIPNTLPKNLLWLVAGVDEKSSLPVKDCFIDETNINFVFIDIHGQKEEEVFEKEKQKLLSEAIRVLRPGGKLFIREPRYIIDFIKPVLESSGLSFSERAMTEEEIKYYDELAVELKEDSLLGDESSEPLVVEVVKNVG